jgi:hypothetical protein
MNFIQSIAAIFAGSGLFIFLLGIPLILRRVPPNAYYGVRTKASLTSEADWYRINSIGGRYHAVSGFIIFIVGIVGFFLPVSVGVTYSISAGVAAFLALIFPCHRLCALKPATSPYDNDRNG